MQEILSLSDELGQQATYCIPGLEAGAQLSWKRQPALLVRVPLAVLRLQLLSCKPVARAHIVAWVQRTPCCEIAQMGLIVGSAAAVSPAIQLMPNHCRGGSIGFGWPGGLAAFVQKPLTSMGTCELSWRSRCGRSEDDVSRLELRACSMLMWRIVSAELLLLMLSLVMRKSSGLQLFSILDSASVTSSLLPPAHAHASWRQQMRPLRLLMASALQESTHHQAVPALSPGPASVSHLPWNACLLLYRHSHGGHCGCPGTSQIGMPVPAT